MTGDFTAQDLSKTITTSVGHAGESPSRQAGRNRFSPELSYGRHFGPPAPGVKQAAVMILLEKGRLDDGCHWSIPLTVRPDHLPDHPGQISLPGGRLEHGESHLQAARREFCEELGVNEFEAPVIAELMAIYVYNSDYFVRPYVAVTEQQYEYSPCPYEVSRVIHLPLETLTDARQYHCSTFSRGRVAWKAPTIQVADDTVWGATAIILGELAALLKPHITR